MEKNIKITEAEWRVMKVLWAHPSSYSSEIVEELQKTTDWKPNTVKTLLSRLVTKKVITFRKENNAYVYTPILTEEECMETESESFLNRLFNGSCNLMVSRLISANKLSKDDINKLRTMLNQMDDEEK
jgi:BlaI family penicillinase repressor